MLVSRRVLPIQADLTPDCWGFQIIGSNCSHWFLGDVFLPLPAANIHSGNLFLFLCVESRRLSTGLVGWCGVSIWSGAVPRVTV